jgi:hypothetical protein
MKRCFLFALLFLASLPCFCWGFYAHKKINYYAVFLLPPEMMVLYKPNIDFIEEHAVDPDKRRYAQFLSHYSLKTLNCKPYFNMLISLFKKLKIITKKRLL